MFDNDSFDDDYESVEQDYDLDSISIDDSNNDDSNNDDSSWAEKIENFRGATWGSKPEWFGSTSDDDFNFYDNYEAPVIEKMSNNRLEPKLYQYPSVDIIQPIMHNNNNFLDGYIKMENNGQHNDGVFVNHNENKIIIANSINYEQQLAYLRNLDNNDVKLYPKFYDVHCYDNKYYVEWDLKQGDFTSFLCDYIPNLVQTQMELEEDYCVLFKQRIKQKNATIKPVIDVPTYNKFVAEIKNVYSEFWNGLKDVIKNMLLQLIDNGFNAIDNKFDNIVYELCDSSVENSFEFKFNGTIKYVRLYFIDVESNFWIIKYEEVVEHDRTRVMVEYDRGFLWSVYGQYRFDNIGWPIL